MVNSWCTVRETLSYPGEIWICKMQTGHITLSSTPDQLLEKTTAQNTTRSNHCIILLSSWLWAWWCPKHVEQAIRSAIETSVASSWHFTSTYLTTMHGQNHIKEVNIGYQYWMEFTTHRAFRESYKQSDLTLTYGIEPWQTRCDIVAACLQVTSDVTQCCR